MNRPPGIARSDTFRRASGRRPLACVGHPRGISRHVGWWALVGLCFAFAVSSLPLGPTYGANQPPPRRTKKKPVEGPWSNPKTRSQPAPGDDENPPEKKSDSDDDEASKAHRAKLSDLHKQDDLPYLNELAVPTVAELHQHAVDWLVLKSLDKAKQLALIVRPVFPRPDTLEKLAADLAALRKQPTPSSAEQRRKRIADGRELQSLIVTLPDDPYGQLYEIPTDVLDHIVYHEDLVILRAGLLIDDKQLRVAFELLYGLERQTPGWKGLADTIQRLLFREADQWMAAGDLESALTDLEELHSRRADYPGLQERLGEVTDKLIVRSSRAEDFRQARHFLHRLAQMEPKHPTVSRWTARLKAEAANGVEEAQKAGQEGRHDQAVTLIKRAARIWPALAGLKDVFRRLCGRYQRLEVGVLSLAGQVPALPFPTLADRREARMTRFDLFEIDRIDDATHYKSRLFEEWEPADLGRRAAFRLKSTRARWESRPLLRATDVMRTLESLLDHASGSYDERLAGYVNSVRIRSPYELEIRFTRAPPRIEPLLRLPVTALGASANSPDRILSRRFDKVRADEREVVYRRAFPQPDDLTAYQMAEVVERKYDSPPHAVQALHRGDISMIPDLPPWAVDVLRDDPRFFVVDYAVPTTHVLQFNPKSRFAKSRELRLALAYAIDPTRILREIVLRDPNSTAGRIVTAPFATTSYAYNSLVVPRVQNLGMAVSLYDAAKKRLKETPVLRMVCEPGASAESAAEEIVKGWKRIGIRAELVTAGAPSSAAPDAWDIAYRTVRMKEPLVELWPFLTVDSRARLETLRDVPDWLRQELLELDNAPDWQSVVERLHALHADLYAEIEYIPLWEIDDAIVLRKNVHDFPPDKFVDTYQDIDRWTVQPWFAEDVP